MRVFARPGLWCFTVTTAILVAPSARAQAPAAKPATPATKAANPNETLATVNGTPITRAQLVDLMSRYTVPAGNEEQIYQDGIETLINMHLINAFLERQKIAVTAEKLDEQFAALEKQLKQDGTDLATELVRSGKSRDEVRKELAERIRWVEYVNARATDAELKRFAESHKDLFSGTQVKASHILVRVEPNASAADKQKAREKLEAIKKEIETNKVTFAEAANKHSEDPGNAEGAGGDVGYFSLNSGFIEEFAEAAFGLKKGSISDVVETPYGFHLIQVTDRKEGSPIDFEQNKPFIKQMYAADLQKQILQAERKAAKTEIKPMPADLFPPAATPPGAATPKGEATPK
ncbi:MAG: peptidylprolyl isomerase [Isosphaeraceae bacterium]